MLRSSSFLKRTVCARRERATSAGARVARGGESARARGAQRRANCRQGLRGGTRTRGAPARPRWPSPPSTCRAPRGRWCLRRHATPRRISARISTQRGASHFTTRGRCAPMLMVAWRLMTSGESGVSLLTSSVARSCVRSVARERQWSAWACAACARSRLLHQPLLGRHGCGKRPGRPRLACSAARAVRAGRRRPACALERAKKSKP